VDILGVIWLEHIVEKLAVKHRVEPYEVEEVLARAARFRRIERGNVAGENLYAAVGATAGGRSLIVFFVYKRTKEAFVVSARDATARERQQYGRK
jgi:uncharacterized protein